MMAKTPDLWHRAEWRPAVFDIERRIAKAERGAGRISRLMPVKDL